MKLIVVGVDGSPAATAAAREALELAEATGAAITFVSTFAPLTVYGAPYYEGSVGADEAPARSAVDAALALAAEREVRAEGQVLQGDAAAEILHVAEVREADLIVVGSRGLGPISSAFVGSVSRWLLAHAHIPVLVVKNRAPVTTH
jgi:nucleotide-binding universal stress UspA family protein